MLPIKSVKTATTVPPSTERTGIPGWIVHCAPAAFVYLLERVGEVAGMGIHVGMGKQDPKEGWYPGKGRGAGAAGNTPAQRRVGWTSSQEQLRG